MNPNPLEYIYAEALTVAQFSNQHKRKLIILIITHSLGVKGDSTRGQAALNGIETAGNTFGMSGESGKSCDTAYLNTTLVLFLSHFHLEVILAIITMREVRC